MPSVPTSMRREGSASEVFGRSTEMRAGLSIANASGVGAGPDRCSVNSSWLPLSGRTLMDCSVLSAASAGAGAAWSTGAPDPSSMPAAEANARAAARARSV